jgi:hypothetical protein
VLGLPQDKVGDSVFHTKTQDRPPHTSLLGMTDTPVHGYTTLNVHHDTLGLHYHEQAKT